MWRGDALRLQGEREAGEASHLRIPVKLPDGFSLKHLSAILGETPSKPAKSSAERE